MLMLFAIMILLIISSSLMYNVEHEAQPDNFSSIPEAMWWALLPWAQWAMEISIR